MDLPTLLGFEGSQVAGNHCAGGAVSSACGLLGPGSSSAASLTVAESASHASVLSEAPLGVGGGMAHWHDNEGLAGGSLDEYQATRVHAAPSPSEHPSSDRGASPESPLQDEPPSAEALRAGASDNGK